MIKVKNVIKRFPNGSTDVLALNNVSVEIGDTDFTVVVGPSGAGKSTLLNIMSGLEKCESGEIIYDSEDIGEYSDKQLTQFRRNNIGFIFQAYYLLPELNVENNIKLGAYLTKNEDYQYIIKALKIGDLLDRMPYQLSGGQQQRVSIARALAKKPKVLFCDEPTGALDEKTGKKVLELLQSYQRKNKVAIVMVTHNLGIAEMATQVVKMNSGKIINIYRNDKPIEAKNVRWA